MGKVLRLLLLSLLCTACGSAIESGSSGYVESPSTSGPSSSVPLGNFTFSLDAEKEVFSVNRDSYYDQILGQLGTSRYLAALKESNVSIRTDQAKTLYGGCAISTSGIGVTVNDSAYYTDTRLTVTVKYPSDLIYLGLGYDESLRPYLNIGDSGGDSEEENFLSLRVGTPSCTNFSFGVALSGTEVESFPDGRLSILRLSYDDIPDWGARDESKDPIADITYPAAAATPAPSPYNSSPSGREDRFFVHVRGDLTKYSKVYYSIGDSTPMEATIEDPGDGSTGILSINGDPLNVDASMEGNMALLLHNDNGDVISDAYWLGSWSRSYLQFKPSPCAGPYYYGVLQGYFLTDLEEKSAGVITPKKGKEESIILGHGFDLLDVSQIANATFVLPFFPPTAAAILMFADCGIDGRIHSGVDYVNPGFQLVYEINAGNNRVGFAAGTWTLYSGDTFSYGEN